MVVLNIRAVQISLFEHPPFVLLGAAQFSALPKPGMHGRHTHRAPKEGGTLQGASNKG